MANLLDGTIAELKAEHAKLRKRMKGVTIAVPIAAVLVLPTPFLVPALYRGPYIPGLIAILALLLMVFMTALRTRMDAVEGRVLLLLEKKRNSSDYVPPRDDHGFRKDVTWTTERLYARERSDASFILVRTLVILILASVLIVAVLNIHGIEAWITDTFGHGGGTSER